MKVMLLFLVVATLRKTESNLIVFTTSASTIITLGKAEEKFNKMLIAKKKKTHLSLLSSQFVLSYVI